VLALLVGLMALHLSAPVLRWPGLLAATLGLGLLIAALASLSRSRAVFWVGAALAAPSLVRLWGWSGLDDPQWVGSAYHAPFFLFTTVVVTGAVLRTERVTEDTLLGSLCAYLFICLAFASLYQAAELARPGSFSGLADRDSLFARLSYFSLVTLTTLGYGDVTPLTPVGQSLAVLESVVGILYPAIVVARIVAVYGGGGGRPFALPEVGPLRESRRVALLAALLVASILALPWVEQTYTARFLLSGTFALVLLGGLYAVTHARRLRWVAAALAAGAFAGRLLFSRGGGSPAAAVTALELGFLAVVIGRVGLWAFRQQRVTAGVLIAAPCLYLLLGLAFRSGYELLERLAPGSLAPSGDLLPSGLLYFSFMTLTTTGFGDITPLRSGAQVLAAMESVVGIFFPAVVLARLVALYDVDS